MADKIQLYAEKIFNRAQNEGISPDEFMNVLLRLVISGMEAAKMNEFDLVS